MPYYFWHILHKYHNHSGTCPLFFCYTFNGNMVKTADRNKIHSAEMRSIMQKKTQIQKFIYSNKEFGLRLARLREQRQISARQMSLDMGQNKNYISSIESGNNYPTMGNFFFICHYLKVTPKGFFEEEGHPPVPNDDFTDLILHLPQKARNHLYLMLSDLMEKEQFPFF